MDPRKHAFLQAVVGPDGARALSKAASSPDLEWAIFPRVVMAWLEVVGQTEAYAKHAPLPGVPDVKMMLVKREGEYGGHINIGDQHYSFVEASLYHVAGSVAIALGVDGQRAPELLRSTALAKLGKNIDLLVKSRALRKAQDQRRQASRINQPGQAAAPRGPMPPTPPQATQQQPGVKPKPRLPRRPTIKITKAELRPTCGACGVVQFTGNRYVGCPCFADLSKAVKTTPTPDGWMLELGPAWDVDALITLAENLR
jgi:hypothetical protein